MGLFHQAQCLVLEVDGQLECKGWVSILGIAWLVQSVVKDPQSVENFQLVLVESAESSGSEVFLGKVGPLDVLDILETIEDDGPDLFGLLVHVIGCWLYWDHSTQGS